MTLVQLLSIQKVDLSNKSCTVMHLMPDAKRIIRKKKLQNTSYLKMKEIEPCKELYGMGIGLAGFIYNGHIKVKSLQKVKRLKLSQSLLQ